MQAHQIVTAPVSTISVGMPVNGCIGTYNLEGFEVPCPETNSVNQWHGIQNLPVPKKEEGKESKKTDCTYMLEGHEVACEEN